MKKLDLSTVPKRLRPNPLFKYMPSSLKDPSCFDDIEKQVTEVMKSDHVHKTVKAFMTCAWCQAKMKERHDLILKLGFNSYEQYLNWKKIMTIIKDKKSFQVR
jgi:hypothetical protein